MRRTLRLPLQLPHICEQLSRALVSLIAVLLQSLVDDGLKASGRGEVVTTERGGRLIQILPRTTLGDGPVKGGSPVTIS